VGTDRYQIIQHYGLPNNTYTYQSPYSYFLLLHLHFGCTHNHRNIPLYICCWFRVIRFPSFWEGRAIFSVATAMLKDQETVVQECSQLNKVTVWETRGQEITHQWM